MIGFQQAFFGNLAVTNGGLHFDPFTNGNRLHALYRAKALMLIPEGVSHLPEGAVVVVSRLD